MASSNMSLCVPSTNATQDVSGPSTVGGPFYALGYVNNTLPSMAFCCQSKEVDNYPNPGQDAAVTDACFSYCNITKAGLDFLEVERCMEGKLLEQGIPNGYWETTGMVDDGEPTPTTTPSQTPTGPAVTPAVTSAPSSGAMGGKNVGGQNVGFMGYAVLGLAFSGAFVRLL